MLENDVLHAEAGGERQGSGIPYPSSAGRWGEAEGEGVRAEHRGHILYLVKFL